MDWTHAGIGFLVMSPAAGPWIQAEMGALGNVTLQRAQNPNCVCYSCHHSALPTLPVRPPSPNLLNASRVCVAALQEQLKGGMEASKGMSTLSHIIPGTQVLNMEYNVSL
ncbi:hypothetical protein GN956_G23383 [Arapaima gigas]